MRPLSPSATAPAPEGGTVSASTVRVCVNSGCRKKLTQKSQSRYKQITVGNNGFSQGEEGPDFLRGRATTLLHDRSGVRGQLFREKFLHQHHRCIDFAQHGLCLLQRSGSPIQEKRLPCQRQSRILKGLSESGALDSVFLEQSFGLYCVVNLDSLQSRGVRVPLLTWPVSIALPRRLDTYGSGQLLEGEAEREVVETLQSMDKIWKANYGQNGVNSGIEGKQTCKGCAGDILGEVAIIDNHELSHDC